MELLRMFNRLLGLIFQNKNQRWTFYAQLVRLFTGFGFVALIAKALSSELLGTWYIFVSLFGVASLVEMGLGQIMGRHAAYLIADYRNGNVPAADFEKLAKVGERIYVSLAVGVSLVAFPIGIFWLDLPDRGGHFPMHLIGAWLIYVLGGMLSLLGAYYAALVNGAGQMWKSQRAAIVVSCTSTSVLALSLLWHGYLLVPALALLSSQIVSVTLLRRAVSRLEVMRTARANIAEPTLDVSATIKSIFGDAGKMLLGMLSYQMLTNGYLLILTKFLPKYMIGSYGLTLQLVSVVISLSMIWSTSNFYDMAAARQSKDRHAIRTIFYSGMARSVTVSALGLTLLFFLAPHALKLVGSKTVLLEPYLLVIVLGCLWVEFCFSQFAQLLIASGDMRPAYASIFIATLVCGSAAVLLYMGSGVNGAILARLVLFLLCYGLPLLLLSRRLLRFSH